MRIKKLQLTSIAEYIKSTAPGAQDKLHQLHTCIQKAAPGAAESLKWKMPVYSYQKILVTFAILKNYIGLNPMTSAIETFAPKLMNYKTGKGSIQFPLDKALPFVFISKIVSNYENKTKCD